jgi:hypothetical protein
VNRYDHVVFLRQHYLDQVLRVDNSAVVLSARSALAPLLKPSSTAS